MDLNLNTLSRRELQALCKSNGIPANKTNVYMVDALAKKRIPLSKIDANRSQKSASSIGSPPLLKSPPVLLFRKSKSIDLNSTGPTQQKPPLFQNNFLRRGKRKDVPTSHEGDHEEKPEVQQTVSSNPQRTHQMGSTRTETIAAHANLRSSQMGSTKAKAADSGLTSETLSGTTTRQSKVESRLKPGIRSGTAANKGAHGIASSAISSDDSTSDGSENAAKEKIEDRVRSQIDAALCSKVLKASERWPSAQASLESFERAPESNVKVDMVDRTESLDLPLPGPEQQGDNLLRLPAGSLEQQMERFSVPQSLVVPMDMREENPLTSTPAVNPGQRSASLEMIIPSPPISFSPLVVRVEEKMRSIVERVQNFWKGSRELAVVNSFGSPVQ